MYTFARILLCACLGACSLPSPTVETTSASIATFDRYRTFSFESSSGPPPGWTASKRSAEVQTEVRPLVATALTQKGYIETPDNGDLVVVIAVGGRQIEKTRTQSRMGTNISGDREETFKVSEGTIAIEAYERSTRAQVWHGLSVSEINRSRIDHARLARTVGTIMVPFPISTRAMTQTQR